VVKAAAPAEGQKKKAKKVSEILLDAVVNFLRKNALS
jgi:hypothetical protein